MDTIFFDRFRHAFELSSPPGVQDSRLLMGSDDAQSLRVYYAPFEYSVPSPRLVLIGITPGKDQVASANRAMWQEVRTGASAVEALRMAKFAGSFRGEPIRSNLLRQIADWKVHEWLGFNSPEEVLDDGQKQGLVQLTSSVRFPVFKGSKGYSGASPGILQNALLRSYFTQFLIPEAAGWGDALVFPLGKKPLAIVRELCDRGHIREQNICSGMFHPSRNNLARLNWVLSDRLGRRPEKTNPAAYDAGRTDFLSRYLAA